MLSERTVLAWHFLPEDGRLRYGPRLNVKAGSTYTATGPLVMCRNGMHASRRAIDALHNAPGPIICRVELSGEMIESKDKLCARRRRVLWIADATRVLHEFGCWCAEQALLREHAAGREPDPRSWAAIEAKRRWLAGEIDNDQLIGAEAAARDAATEIAFLAAKRPSCSAAWAATYAAARDAADWAAWATAWVAACAAAWAAAWAAAKAAWAEQNAELERRLMELRDSECEVG